MAWIQCIIETTQDNAEHCSECLMNADAVAVTFVDAKDNPLFEPLPNTEPLWDHTRVIGLFEHTANLNDIKHYLEEHLDEKTFATLKIEPLEEKDWVSATNQTEAIHFGHNLWIIPSNHSLATQGHAQVREKTQAQAQGQAHRQAQKKEHEQVHEQTNHTYVILDAGLAFGTGTHPTTALCLEWLAENPPKNKTVLDYGCGSGILAIAAKKLGATCVYAVDHDPQALYSTQENAKKNSLPMDSIITMLPEEVPVDLVDLNVDLILANILAEPLIALAPRFAEWLRPKGVLILSGILDKQLPLLQERYAPWFSDFKIDSKDEWVRIQTIKI